MPTLRARSAICLQRDGDIIAITAGKLAVRLSDEELTARRKAAWIPRSVHFTTGWLAR
jgi:dihydroxyacid dehydratase/phosphogluconate dehydratase